MSSLLEPDFSLIASDTQLTTTTNNAKKLRSLVWAHTRCPTESENQAFLYCLYYKPGSLIVPYGTASTSNITKHINRHYLEIIIKKALSKNQEAINY